MAPLKCFICLLVKSGIKMCNRAQLVLILLVYTTCLLNANIKNKKNTHSDWGQCHSGIVGTMYNDLPIAFVWGSFSDVVCIRLLCLEKLVCFYSLCLFSDSESSNTTGTTDTQPSGDYYGDSKHFSINITYELGMHQKILSKMSIAYNCVLKLSSVGWCG